MQQGSLIRGYRKCGPDVWQFRWAERGPFGKRIYRRRVIGTVCQYPDALDIGICGHAPIEGREAVQGLRA